MLYMYMCICKKKLKIIVMVVNHILDRMGSKFSFLRADLYKTILLWQNFIAIY